MDFLNGDALLGHRNRFTQLYSSICSHLDYLKEEQPVDCGHEDETLADIGEKNAFLLSKVVSSKLESTDLSISDTIRLLSHKTSALLACENLTEAYACAKKAYRIGHDANIEESMWTACIDCVLVARMIGNLKDAEYYLGEAFKQAVSTYQKQKTAIMKGELLLARGKLNDAIDNVLSPLLDEVNDKRLKGLLLQKLGNGCRSAAKWGPAKDYLRQSIQIANELHDVVDEFNRHGDLGNVYRSEGRMKEALEHQWLHLKFALNRGDLSSLTVACFNVGFSNYTIKPCPNLNNAMVFTLLNNVFATQTHYETLRGISLNNLGKIYMALKLYKEAIPVLLECVQVAKKTGNVGGEGMAYGNLGTAYRALKNYDEAIKYHEMYKENARKRGDDGGMSIMNSELTLDHLLKGDLDSALREVTESIATNEAIRSQLGGEDSSKLANFEKNQANAFNLLILILKKQGRVKQALAVSELARARALTDRLSLIKVCESNKFKKWVRMENILVENLLDDDFINEVIDDYIETATKLNSTFVVYSLITEFNERGTQQKWMYIWTVHPESIASQEKVRFECLKICDSRHSSLLNFDENFFRGLTRSFNATSPSLSQPESKAKVEAEPDSSSEYSVKTVESASSIIEQLQDLKLKNLDETVEEAIDEDDKFLTKLRDMKLSGGIPVKATNENIRVQIGDEPPQNDGIRQLKMLYEICISTIKHILLENLPKDSIPRLIIIPQEFLFNIPFAALLSEDDKYLIEDHVISYTPSLRALLLLNKIQKKLSKGDKKLKVLSVGNPKMPFKQVEQIEHSEEEAKNVQNIFGEDSCILLTGADATKNTVLSQMKDVDILHVASHAFPQDLLPATAAVKATCDLTVKEFPNEFAQKTSEGDFIMRGCILLAKSHDQCNGLLHAYEIEREKVNFQLVTLSCCETGIGKVTGDGIVGLYRSFLATGTSKVIVTMWKIPDHITPVIMKAFYEDYIKSKDAASALRKAMLGGALGKKLPPSQWAAFSLIGACI